MKRMWQFISSLWRRRNRKFQPGYYTLRIKSVKLTPQGMVAEYEVLDARPLREGDFPTQPPLKRIEKSKVN